MRYCKKITSQLCKQVLCLTFCIWTVIAYADGISIIKTTTQLDDNGYKISADFRITLPSSVADALKRGVALTFVSEFTMMRSRWYWLDTTVIEDEQISKLSYNALTRQYRISRGSLFLGFTNLDSALRVLGHLSAPTIPSSVINSGSGYIAKILNSETRYTAFVQMRLDASQLPRPLQVSALTNSDWNLESEKYNWAIQPDKPKNEEKSSL